MRIIVARLGIVLTCAILLGACSGNTDPDGQPILSEGVYRSAEQLEAIGDGSVTQDEYEAGYRRFAGCLLDAGFELQDLGRENEIIRFGIPSDAVESGDEARCYQAEFEMIDIGWQVSREDTSETADLARECLVNAGIEPAETLQAMHEQLSDAGISWESCLTG